MCADSPTPAGAAPRDEARARNQKWLAHAERVQEGGARQAFEEIPALVGYLRTLVSEAAASRADQPTAAEVGVTAAAQAFYEWVVANVAQLATDDVQREFFHRLAIVRERAAARRT